eukprot:s2461_g6.t1
MSRHVAVSLREFGAEVSANFAPSSRSPRAVQALEGIMMQPQLRRAKCLAIQREWRTIVLNDGWWPRPLYGAQVSSARTRPADQTWGECRVVDGPGKLSEFLAYHVPSYKTFHEKRAQQQDQGGSCNAAATGPAPSSGSMEVEALEVPEQAIFTPPHRCFPWPREAQEMEMTRACLGADRACPYVTAVVKELQGHGRVGHWCLGVSNCGETATARRCIHVIDRRHAEGSFHRWAWQQDRAMDCGQDGRAPAEMD